MGEFRRIDVSHRNGVAAPVVVVAIRDEKLSGPTLMQELAQELSAFLEQSEQKNILLNLSAVEFISSAALNRLINFQRRVRESGGKLVLCDMRPSIESVFAATRLNQVFELCNTEADALTQY